MESGDSKAEASVYDRHGTEQRRVVVEQSKMRSSWSELHQEEGGKHNKASMVEMTMVCSGPGVGGQLACRRMRMTRSLLELRCTGRVTGVRSQDRDRSEYMMNHGRRYDNPCLSFGMLTTCPTLPSSPTCKSARFPARSRKGIVM